MSTLSPVLKYSELLNRLVLDRDTVAEVGRVSRFLLDSQAQKIVGFICKSGWLGNQQKTFAWKEIEAIGADSVIVKHQDEQTSGITESVNPVLGSEVWTNSGNKVGKIIDLLFHKETGDVVNYMFSPNGWQGLIEGTYLLAPIMISSVGDKRIIILEKAVENPQKYTEGLGEKLSQATEFIQQDYEQTKQNLEAAKPGLQKAVDQVKFSERISQAREFIQQDYEKTKQDLEAVKPGLEKAVDQVKLGDKISQAREFIQQDYEKTKQDLEAVKPGLQKAVEKVKGSDKIKTDQVEENPSTAETKLQGEPPKSIDSGN
ncbi:PRC-barrel domain-containing protein [Nodularia harveyana UHCC-0300]|uniref:PRC-barrel domain-containing protein n=1 Tax=Nodularia harveyana UHCC-0300 TaxID=2974287 RepID=A0ABU5U8L4_9CYAN|nr:PRC-barrel domain-containing protein [Nodularia harveyana]MEA5579862.1 PRC-barrel domain-containing protein [Nodularia harveyana UHCC-0300]